MSQPQATIRHPQYTEKYVTVHKPLRSELFGLDQKRARLEAPIAIQDAEGNVLYDKETRQPFFYVQPRLESMEMRIERLRRYLDGWGGITDVDGVPLQYKPENIKWLFEEHLDVQLPVCAFCDGAAGASHGENQTAPHPYVDKIPYGTFILKQITENAKLFDPDPTVTESALQ